VILGEVFDLILLIVVILVRICVISARMFVISGRIFDVALLIVLMLARICVIPGRIL